MTLKQRERELAGVTDMLRKHAWTFHYLTGIPFEELMGEAYLGFMQACEKFVKGHGKFSTWCYTKVSCHLRFYIRAKFKDRLWLAEEVLETIPDRTQNPSVAFRASLAEQTKDLSPEAQRMIQLILDTPVPDGELKPREFLKSVCQELAYEGYDATHTGIMIHEIKQALAE